jgi:hypothetical protein
MAMCFCYLKYNNLRWDVAWNYIIYSHPLAASAAASSYPRDICASDSCGDKKRDPENPEKRMDDAGIKIRFWSFMHRYFAFC